MEAIDLNDDGQNDVMDEDIEDHEVLEDSEANGGTQPRQVQSRRKVSRCWRKFTILGGRLSDGTTKIRCNLCRRFYFLNLRRNGTSTLTRHMKVCPKAVGTPRSSARKVDMMVFREIIAMAIIEHDLPYKFVEYKRIRMAFTYANSSIEYWSRNTAASDVLKIYEQEKHVSSFVKDTTDHPRHHPIPSEEPELQSRVFL